MTGKSNANIGFEKQLWNAACELWGHIPAADYRKVIVGLIFLRYISNAFEKRYTELVAEGEGFENDFDAYREKNIFFVPEAARWSKIAEAAHTPEIGIIIDNAMQAIEANNDSLKNVLPKNYANQDLDKRVLGNVVDLFTNNIDMSDTNEDKDLLGRTYEYCIAQFAAYEGTKGGEFYTPSSIVRTIVEVLKPFDDCRVYDPCCGSGGMFVQSVKFLQAHSGNRNRISIYGQESNADTWKMAKMNMAIRGIDADFGPYQADTFFNDLHPTLKADFIMANPPFNLSNWGQDKLKNDVRWKYGIPPAGNANYAWIQHMIHHLAPKGKIGLVLANGALSTQTGGEGEIRRRIIEDDLIEGIIALPPQLFYSVTIPVTLWFITKGKKQSGHTVFIDARKMGHMVDRKHRDFSDADIKKLADTFTSFQEGTLQNIKGFCTVVTTADIAAQDYILTPGRYVGIEDAIWDDEPFDDKMKRLTTELSSMFEQSHELEEDIRQKLGAIGWEIKEKETMTPKDILYFLLIHMKDIMESQGKDIDSFQFITKIPEDLHKKREIEPLEEFLTKYQIRQNELDAAIKYGIANNYIKAIFPSNMNDKLYEYFYIRQRQEGNPVKLTKSGLKKANELILNDYVLSNEEGLNELLKKSRTLFVNKDFDGALEKIWDAFERVKTILDEKPIGAQKLCEICATSLSKEKIEAEFKALTEIGNKYHIRHFETDKISLKDEATKKYLYYRMDSLLKFVIKQTKV